jgi:hypothetical protein
MNRLKLLLVLTLALSASAVAWAAHEVAPETLPPGRHMYVIERDMPGLGKLTAVDLKGAARKSCRVLRDLGPEIIWLHSYVTGDKMYCVYLAPSKELVLEHAEKGGFPANSVSEVSTIIGPQTADE